MCLSNPKTPGLLCKVYMDFGSYCRTHSQGTTKGFSQQTKSMTCRWNFMTSSAIQKLPCGLKLIDTSVEIQGSRLVRGGDTLTIKLFYLMSVSSSFISPSFHRVVLWTWRFSHLPRWQKCTDRIAHLHRCCHISICDSEKETKPWNGILLRDKAISFVIDKNMFNLGYQLWRHWRKHNETQFQLKRIRNHWWKLLVAINLGIKAFSVFIPDGALPRAAVRFSPSISLYRRIISINWQLHKYWKSNTAFLLMKLSYPFPIGDGHMTWVAKLQYVWWWVLTHSD